MQLPGEKKKKGEHLGGGDEHPVKQGTGDS